TEVFAIGGPAARSYTDATPVLGVDRHDTAVRVAEEFFDAPLRFGVARRDDFADALTGGAHIAKLDGPVLLSPTDGLPDVVIDYVCGLAPDIDYAFLYGGQAALGAEVFDRLEQIVVQGAGCS